MTFFGMRAFSKIRSLVAALALAGLLVPAPAFAGYTVKVCLEKLREFAKSNVETTYGNANAERLEKVLQQINARIAFLKEKKPDKYLNLLAKAEAKKAEVQALLEKSRSEQQANLAGGFILGKSQLGVSTQLPKTDDTDVSGGFLLGQSRLGIARLGGGSKPAARGFILDESVLDGPDVLDGPVDPPALEEAPAQVTALPAGPKPITGPQKFLTVESAQTVLAEYFDPKEPEPGSAVENFLRLALGDAILGPRLLSELQAMNVSAEKASVRQLLMAAMKDYELRSTVVRIARETLAQKEAALLSEEVSRIGPNMVAPGVDMYFMGAGLHEGAAQNFLRQFAPDIATRTTEKTDEVAHTFAQGNKAVSLNSSSKKPDRENYRQRLGEGDLNLLPGGITQVHQFDNSANPDQESFAHAQTVNRSFGKPIIFNRTAVSVIDNPNFARDGYEHLVIESDGTRVPAHYVFNFGLGEERIPDIEGLAPIFEKAQQEVTDPRVQPPQVTTYGGMFTFVRFAPNPFKPFSGGRWAVVGGGDSGKAVVRYLLRTNVVNPLAYGRDSTDVPGPTKIGWFGQECVECTAFFEANRSFYNDITKGYRNRVIQARPKMAKVERGADGELLLTDAEGLTEPYEGLILTTGFESQIPSLYETILGARAPKGTSAAAMVENPEIFEDIRGYERTVSEDGQPVQVTLARRLLRSDGTPTNIIQLGPSAGRIVSRPELKEIEENYVANANHNWRVWLTVQAVVEDIRSKPGRRNSGLSPQTEPKMPLKLAGSSDRDRIYVLNMQRAASPRSAQVGDSTLLASRVYEKLSRYGLGQFPSVTVIVSNTGEGFSLRFEPALDKAQSDALLAQFSLDEEMLRLVQESIGNGRRARTLRMEFALRDGALAPSGTILETEKTADEKIAKIIEAQGASLRLRVAALTAAEMEAVQVIMARDQTQREYSRDRTYAGYDGYPTTAKEIFGGNMARAHDAISQMGLRAKLKWPAERFTGSLDEYYATLERVRRDEKDREYNRDRPYKGYDGYVKMAREVFRGDMVRAHRALVELGQKSNLNWPDVFNGTVEEFDGLLESYRRDRKDIEYSRDRVNARYDGYSRVAKLYFSGDMARAHARAEEMDFIRDMAWPQAFNGSASQFDALLEAYRRDRKDIEYSRDRIYRGWDGYARAAREIFKGDMALTHDRASEMGFVEPMVWGGRFEGTLPQFEACVAAYRRDKKDAEYSRTRVYKGQDGYAKLAQEAFDGDLEITFDRMEEVVGDEIVKRLGWNRIPPRASNAPKAVAKQQSLEAAEASKLRGQLFIGTSKTQPRFTGGAGLAAFAQSNYRGDMGSAYRDVAAKLGVDATVQLGWSSDLDITSTLANQILSDLPGSGWFSAEGFYSKYRDGAGLKLVSKTYFGGDTAKTIRVVQALFGEKFKGLDW